MLIKKRMYAFAVILLFSFKGLAMQPNGLQPSKPLNLNQTEMNWEDSQIENTRHQKVLNVQKLIPRAILAGISLIASVAVTTQSSMALEAENLALTNAQDSVLVSQRGRRISRNRSSRFRNRRISRRSGFRRRNHRARKGDVRRTRQIRRFRRRHHNAPSQILDVKFGKGNKITAIQDPVSGNWSNMTAEVILDQFNQKNSFAKDQKVNVKFEDANGNKHQMRVNRRFLVNGIENQLF